MNKKKILKHLLIIYLLIFMHHSFSFTQRTEYSREEIMSRRHALMDQVKGGMIILFGESMPQPGAHFRQDNDFYYFTGIEDINAVLIMVHKTKEAFLFLPRQTPREEMIEGPNLLKDPKAKKKTGFESTSNSSDYSIQSSLA